MLNDKLLEVLTHPSDGALCIVSQGVEQPHLANTWNSYVITIGNNRLLIPAGGMGETERNLKRDKRVILSIASREVQGKRYKGTGFLVKGTAQFLTEGQEFSAIQEKFPWARAALEVTITDVEQTL